MTNGGWQSRGTRYSASADTGEAFVQVAALQEGLHAVLDDRAPEAVLGRKPLVVDLLEGVEVLVQQPPQIGGMRIADHRSALVPAIQRQRLDTRRCHSRKSSSWSHTATLRVQMREKAEVVRSSLYPEEHHRRESPITKSGCVLS